MARYLLIEVDSNASADRLRAQIDDADKKDKGIRVVGMFRKATQLCECKIRDPKSVRGARFGWWLCPQCRKPKNLSTQTLENMLEMDDQPPSTKHWSTRITVTWVWDKLTERVATYLFHDHGITRGD